MSRQEDARAAALKSFKEAVQAGAEKEVAVEAAVARFRAFEPEATEADVRRALAGSLAEEHLAALDPPPSPRANRRP